MKPWPAATIILKALAVATVWAAGMRGVEAAAGNWILQGTILALSAGVVVFVGLSFFIHIRE